MPAKRANERAGGSAAEIAAKLPAGFWLRRGHVRDAFGLSEEEMTALVPDVFKPTYLPANKRRGRQRSRAVFARTQVLAVARRWEGGA